jgi:hypothetical protein
MKIKLPFLKCFILVSFSVILLLAILGCGSSREFVSSRPTQAIQIDGNSQDWQGSLQSFPDKKYSLGLSNDDKYLYLCFTTSDRQVIFNSIRSGLNIELNSPKDASKSYTIKFPVINAAAFTKAMSAFGDEALQKEGIGFLFQDILDNLTQFNLLQKEMINTIQLKNEFGIELKAGTTNELLVFELKVPLESAESRFSAGALPGEKINVAISTDPSRVAFREGMSAGGSNGPSGRGRVRSGSNADNARPSDSSQPSITEKFETGFSFQLVK